MNSKKAKMLRRKARELAAISNWPSVRYSVKELSTVTIPLLDGKVFHKRRWNVKLHPECTRSVYHWYKRGMPG